MTHNGTVLSRRGLLRVTGGLAAPFDHPRACRRYAGGERLRRRVPGDHHPHHHRAVREEVRRQGHLRQHRQRRAELREDPCLARRARLRRRRGTDAARGDPRPEGEAAGDDHRSRGPEPEACLAEKPHDHSADRRRARLSVYRAAVEQDASREAGIVGELLGPGSGVRRQDQGPPDRIRAGQSAVGLCADHGGEAEGRRRGQHRPRLGAVAGAEAVDRRQRHGIRRGGAVFRK